jgi:peptidoglycan/LPS O-acetylase OafA/YrhL
MQSQKKLGIDSQKKGTVKPQWRQDIQGMRGVTMIVIVLFHAGLPIPGGFVSLDAFFVISGFVITGMLLREHSKYGKVSLASFYLRRFKRLTPALIFMVSVVLVLAIALTSPLYVQSQTALTGLGATFLTANIVIQATTGGYFDPAVELNPLLHTWSLSVEEQFYLIFPVLLALGWFVGRRLRTKINVPILLVTLVAGISLAATLLPKDIPGAPSWFIPLFGYYSPVVRTWEFAAGALLFFGTRKWTQVNQKLSTFLALSGVLLFFAPMWIIDPSVPYPGPWTIAPVTGTMLVILAGFNTRNSVTRGLSSKPLVFVGDRSYSWYLWHWPVIVFAATIFPSAPTILLTGAIISIIPALISYKYIENPIRLRQMSPKTIVAMLIASVATATALAVGLFLGSVVSWNSSTVATAKEQIETNHLAQEKGCHVFTPLDLPSYENCWFTVGSGLPIYMVGDSNADQFSEALIGAGKILDRPVSITTVSACPFLIDFRGSFRCKTYVDNTLDWIDSQRSATVVIAMSSGYGQGSQEGLIQYTDALRKTVAAVQVLGHTVAIVQAIPNIVYPSAFGNAWTAGSCPTYQVVQEGCGVTTTLQDAASSQGDVWAATKSVAKESDSSLIQVSEGLCPDQTCKTFTDGEWSYTDSNHITSDQSASLASIFSQALP